MKVPLYVEKRNVISRANIFHSSYARAGIFALLQGVGFFMLTYSVAYLILSHDKQLDRIAIQWDLALLLPLYPVASAILFAVLSKKVTGYSMWVIYFIGYLLIWFVIFPLNVSLPHVNGEHATTPLIIQTAIKFLATSSIYALWCFVGAFFTIEYKEATHDL